jgi:hypothetical protein
MVFLRVNWHSSVTLGMYSEGSEFESQLGHQLCLLRSFYDFPWSHQSNAGIVPQAMNFFYYFFSFYRSCICLTLYSVTTESRPQFFQSFQANSRIVPQISLGGHILPHFFQFVFHQSS